MPPSLSRQLGARVSEQSVCGTASGGGNWVHKLVVYVTNGRHFLKKKTKHFPFTCFEITHGVTRGSFSTFFEVLCYQRLAPIEGFPTVERTERRSPPRVTEDFFFYKTLKRKTKWRENRNCDGHSYNSTLTDTRRGYRVLCVDTILFPFILPVRRKRGVGIETKVKGATRRGANETGGGGSSGGFLWQ